MRGSRGAKTSPKGEDTEGAALLTAEQRARLLAAQAWWQEGERRLEFLAEKANRDARLAQAQTLLAELRAQPTAEPDTLRRLLRLARALAPNRALHRGRETTAFGEALRDLLFGARPLPERLAHFLESEPVGAQTASQLLFLAFPDRFPLVSTATRAALAPTRAQRSRARHIARQRFGAGDDTPPAVLSLLADFVLYDAVREILGADTFADVNAVLWHARQMPPSPSRDPRRASRIAEPSAEYASPEPSTSEDATEPDLLARIEGQIAAEGFTFPALTVRDYYIALKTRPFVILAGLSGTGKTRLTELFARALTDGSDAQYLLLPVRPDWTDPAPLMGYFNLLTDRYVSTPFLDLLEEAGRPENADRAFFVCLDEMNLARVEHYFADVLSAMETPTRQIPLHGARTVRIPGNVFLTGSVNVDEATHPFSRKVLDRANTIEFTDVDFGRYQAGSERAPRVSLPAIAPAERQRLFLRARVADAGEAQDRLAALDPSFPNRVLDTLSTLNARLAPRGMHFGYRVRDHVLMYVANAFDGAGRGLLAADPSANLAIALDLQITQKALPRISGTQEALEPLLNELSAWAGDAYPRTTAKLARMRRRAEEEGVVSFYEP